MRENKKGWIKTDYHYKEDWQYQEVWFNKDLDILRRQNHLGKLGTIIDTEDIFKFGDKEYLHLYSAHVAPIIIEALGVINE